MKSPYLNFPRFPRSILALAIATSLSACGTLTGIPSHGGGKRFATEQRLVSASIRAALKDIDVTALYGKKAAIVFDLVHDEGGGSLDGGRLSLTGALSRGLLMSPGTSTSSAFQVFDLIDSNSNYSNSAFTGSNSATSTYVGTGTAATTGQNSSTGNSTSNTTSTGSGSFTNSTSGTNTSSGSNAFTGTSNTTGANTTSISNATTGSGSNNSTSTTAGTNSNNTATNNTNTLTGSNTSTATTTGTGPAVTATTSGFTQNGSNAGTTTSNGTNNTSTSNTGGYTNATNTTGTNTSNSSNASNSSSTSSSNNSSSNTNAASGSNTTSNNAASNSSGSNSGTNQSNTNSNNNSSTTQANTSASSNNQAGGASTNRQVISNQPSSTQVTNSGYKTEGSVGLAYKGLGEYHNFNVPKSDASLLMGLVRSYLLLNGITPTTPTDQSAEVLLYVTVDIFGIIRQRSDFYIYNEENVKAETSFEISAYDRKGKLIMNPTTANREARYKERYIIWAGPFATSETLHEGKGLMVDFSDVAAKTEAAVKSRAEKAERATKAEKAKIINPAASNTGNTPQ